ncbi:MAG: OB-fold nucleic acid binding domain-containing protein [Nanoarchaeota archaeon]
MTMIQIPYEDIVAKIVEKSSLTREEVDDRVRQKCEQLSGLISKEGAAHIIANELGIRLLEGFTGKLQIKNILPGMRNVEVLGRAVDVYDVKSFSTQGREGKVGSFILGDDTGTIRVTVWNEQTRAFAKLHKQDTVKIQGGYVRDNNGRKEIHINDRSTITVNPSGEVAPASGPSVARKPLKELKENESNVEVMGTVVQVFEPKYFEVCPSCGKRIRPEGGSFSCAAHGVVMPDYSYVCNVFLDDGTDNMRIVFFGRQSDQLFKKDKEAMLSFRENIAAFEPLKNDLLGNIIKVQGRVSKNQMFDRLELLANSVEVSVDPDAELKRLSEQKS